MANVVNITSLHLLQTTRVECGKSSTRQDHTLPTIDLGRICLHKGQIFRELLNFFKDNKITPNAKFQVDIILPNGKSEGEDNDEGNLRDILSDFWTDFYNKCTEGDVIRVPFLRHDMNDDWEACARILNFGYKEHGYLPIRLAEPFLVYAMSKDIVDSDAILESFLEYLEEMDRDIIKQALEDFESVERDELEDVLATLEVRVAVKKENFERVIREVAEKTLIHTPAFVADQWFPILRTTQLKESIGDLRKKLIPTVRNVLHALKFPEGAENNKKQLAVVGYLKKYLKGNSEKLEHFVKYCTGILLHCIYLYCEIH